MVNLDDLDDPYLVSAKMYDIYRKPKGFIEEILYRLGVRVIFIETRNAGIEMVTSEGKRIQIPLDNTE